MTWSLSHTIAYSSDADSHTAMGYLFDTALPALSQITVSAHPDASSTKRSVKRTTTSLFTNASYEEYFWVNWSSTSPTSINWYEDATYTTTPGDTGTDATNLVSSSMTLNLTNQSWKFWTSDQNANALLVTRGKTLMLWEPGWSVAALMEDPSWTGASDSLRTQIFPGLNSSFLYSTGWPSTSSATTSSEYTLVPSLAVNSGTYWDGPRIDMNCPWMFTSSTGGAPGTLAQFAFPGVGNDVGMYRPAVSNTSERLLRNTSNDGELFLVNGRYYLNSAGAGTSGVSVMFDFGTSEPDFT